MSNTYKKDFYAFLPKYMTTNLEKVLEDYGKEKWFPDAWEEYRRMVYSLNKRRIPTPNLFFDKKNMEAIKGNESQVQPEIQKHYEKYFKPTVQEQIRRDIQNDKKNFRKNKNRNH